MKQVIDGKRYDTETAERVAYDDNSLPVNDFNNWDETLYRTKTVDGLCTVEADPDPVRRASRQRLDGRAGDPTAYRNPGADLVRRSPDQCGPDREAFHNRGGVTPRAGRPLQPRPGAGVFDCYRVTGTPTLGNVPHSNAPHQSANRGRLCEWPMHGCADTRKSWPTRLAAMRGVFALDLAQICHTAIQEMPVLGKVEIYCSC